MKSLWNVVFIKNVRNVEIYSEKHLDIFCQPKLFLSQSQVKS